MAELRATIVGEFKGKKAFGDAEKATSKLDKSVKKLGVALAAAFSVRAIVNFGKASVRASLQAQAEQDRLNQLLTVGVGATASQVAALNDQAQALEKLGVVTAGNITQTQSQLATFNLQTSTIEKLTPAILDYVTAEKGATASTSDFKQMTNGLAQALNGNFSSLTRVGFVIDENTKKQIKSGNESQRAQAIVDVLNSTYKDFNKSLRATPAGQMQVLSNAAEDAQTIIGGRLLDSLQLLGGEGNTVEPLANSMQDLAIYTGDAIFGLAKLLDKLKGMPGVTGFFEGYLKFAKFAGVLGVIDLLAKSGAEDEPGMGGYPSSALGPGYIDPNVLATKKRIAAEKEAAKLQKQLLANDNKRLKAEKARAALAKAQLALGEASKTLDLERIGIEAALKGEISETDRLSLLLQKAILNENASLATQLADQLTKSINRQNEINALLLATPEAPNPYRNWKVPEDLLNYTAASLGVSPETVINAPGSIPTPMTDSKSELLDAIIAANAAQLKADAAAKAAESVSNIYLKVELDGDEIASSAKQQLTNQSLSGSFSTVNRVGRFEEVFAI